MRLARAHWSVEVDNCWRLTDGKEWRVSKRFPFPQMKLNPFHSGAYTCFQTKLVPAGAYSFHRLLLSNQSFSGQTSPKVSLLRTAVVLARVLHGFRQGEMVPVEKRGK